MQRYYENEDFKYDSLTGLLYHNRRKGPVREGQLCGQRLNSHGYKTVCHNYRTVKQHQIIWFLVYGRYPKEIDHISGIRANNKLGNLREVTRLENNRNKAKSSNNKSGVTGVHFDKRRNKWRALIKVKQRNVSLGSYKHFNNAVRARKAAEKKYGFHPNHGKTIKERSKYVSS